MPFSPKVGKLRRPASEGFLCLSVKANVPQSKHRHLSSRTSCNLPKVRPKKKKTDLYHVGIRKMSERSRLAMYLCFYRWKSGRCHFSRFRGEKSKEKRTYTHTKYRNVTHAAAPALITPKETVLILFHDLVTKQEAGRYLCPKGIWCTKAQAIRSVYRCSWYLMTCLSRGLAYNLDTYLGTSTASRRHVNRSDPPRQTQRGECPRLLQNQHSTCASSYTAEIRIISKFNRRVVYIALSIVA